jgi:predicted RNA binding protein YcfA (HicA-like mRNA interferase family)
MPATQKDWIKRLRREGWTQEKGSNHQVKMTKPGCRPITLPMNKRKPYPKGLEAELRREASLQDKRP